MKVEIHSHTNRYSPASRIPPSELVTMAEASGYDALFITEYGKVWSSREIAGLNEMTEHLHVYPGIELTLPDGQNVLVLGADNPVYESLTTPSEIFAQACADGYLTVLSHPFPWGEALPRYLALADAIETQTSQHPGKEQAAAQRSCVEKFHLAEVFASNALGLNYVNRFWIETLDSFATVQEFRRLVLAGRTVNRRRESADDTPLTTKASSFAELSEDDLNALDIQPDKEATRL
ncbi:MAG: hypothetical protein WC655_10245 [Candidatus Hydrogenedentales bacterium]|jgi:hypothetical protein